MFVGGRTSLRREYPSLSSSRRRCSDSMRCLRTVSRRLEENSIRYLTKYKGKRDTHESRGADSLVLPALLDPGLNSSSSSSSESSLLLVDLVRLWAAAALLGLLAGTAIGLKRCERGTVAAYGMAGGDWEPLPRLVLLSSLYTRAWGATLSGGE